MATLLFKDHPLTKWRTGHDFPQVTLTAVAWDTAPDTPVAYVFFGHVNIDFDGSPTAYGPPGISPMPDDDLGNAWGDENGWFGVFALKKDDPLVTQGTAVIDNEPALLHKDKYPVVQQARNGDPKPGYYVSTTPHPTGPRYLQNSYVDASQIAYGALSGQLAALGFKLGDYGLAIRHDKNLQSGFYFVDRGGSASFALGECSHKVGKNLGGSGRANGFNNNFPVSFIVFPDTFTMDGSAGTPSMSDDEIKIEVDLLLADLAKATNAEDLALLMAFNEVAPLEKPPGKAGLDLYHKAPANTPKPAHYTIVADGLRRYGYSFP
jgi:hypothetical protein